ERDHGNHGQDDPTPRDGLQQAKGDAGVLRVTQVEIAIDDDLFSAITERLEERTRQNLGPLIESDHQRRQDREDDVFSVRAHDAGRPFIASAQRTHNSGFAAPPDGGWWRQQRGHWGSVLAVTVISVGPFASSSNRTNSDTTVSSSKWGRFHCQCGRSAAAGFT